MPRLIGRPLAALTLVVVLGLAGCTGTSPATPSAAPSAPDSAATQTAPAEAGAAPETAAPVALVPNGTAAQNQPIFTQVVQTVWSGPDQVAGRAYIDALSAAGFDKGSMQVTSDETTIGNAAESIEFSVRVGDECLVGQVGPSIGDPVTAVLPGLSTGGCLVGQTRPIDW